MVAAFADVLEWIKGIPNTSEAARVTEWVKEKYKIEIQLEEKVERLEKTLTNRDYQIKTMSQELRANRSQINKLSDCRREKEQKEMELMAKIQELEQKNMHNEKIIEELENGGNLGESEEMNDENLDQRLYIISQRLEYSERRLDEVTKQLEETKDAKEKLMKEMNEKLQASNEKLQLERDNHQTIYSKFIESKKKMDTWSSSVIGMKNSLEAKYFSLISEIAKERRESDKTIKVVESALHGAESHLMEKMTTILHLQNECKKLTEQLDKKESRIQELIASERVQCEQRIISQDKLLAQMEKNIELQEEVKKVTAMVQNLGVEEMSSDDDDEADTKKEKVEIAAPVTEEDYRSDSSFDPVDDDDLYN